jgi:hypothetical protein
MKHILIVGAGPSAYISALTCLEQNLKVSILNPQIEQWNSFDESRLLQKLILKKRDKRLLFRVPRNMTKIESKEIEIFENFNSGGLSELWGGVFLPPLSDEYFLVENTKKEIEKAIKFIQDSIHIDGEDSEVYQTYQKRELHNKKIKSKPPIAKSVKDMEKNWSARESLNQINSKNIDFIDGYLESVKQNAKNKVEICYRNRSGDKNSFKVDKVFLATGVFGTARILFDNMPDINEIEISDSNVSYGVGLYLGSKIKSKLEKQMSPYLIQVDGEASGEARKFTQIYELSEELIDSIRFGFLRLCVMQVNKIFRNRLRLVMIFSPSDASDSIVLKRGHNKLIGYRNKRKKVRDKFSPDFAKTFLSNQILPFPLKMNFKPGSGVHSGAFCISMGGKNERILCHELKKWPDIHILGSSSMSRIPAGPIMFSAMVNSRLITQNQFK